MPDYKKLRQQRFERLNNPVLRDHFDAIRKRPKPPFLSVGMMRRFANRVDPKTLHDPDVVYEDATAEGPNGPIPLRIFRPRNLGPGPHGIYVHIHHGGFVMFGGLDTMTAHNIRLTKLLDCIVVGVDFRLPPENPFPAPLNDCFAAFQWTAKNADALGGTADRIGIGGGCTGANLATATTILARDVSGPTPAAQALYAPTFDMRGDYQSYDENGESYFLTSELSRWVNRQYCKNWDVDRFDWRASPVLTPSLKNMPPTLIHVGEWDILRDESVLYADRLRDAGCDVKLIVEPQQCHIATPLSAPTIDREIAGLLSRTIGSRAPT